MAAAVLLFGVTPAAFAAGGARQWSTCDVGGGMGTTCELHAIADSASRAMTTRASVHAPALNASGGAARAFAAIDESIRVQKRARTVTVTATVLVSEAHAELGSVTPAPGDRAAAELSMIVALPLTEGWIYASAEEVIADTDPATPAPKSLNNVTRTVTATVTLAPGQSLYGGGSASITNGTDSLLTNDLVVTDRRATATADMAVQSITVTTA